jgi:hypothetical protein
LSSGLWWRRVFLLSIATGFLALRPCSLANSAQNVIPTEAEQVCIEKGIGYDELIAEAVMDLYRKGDLQEQDVKDEDPADWWKNA